MLCLFLTSAREQKAALRASSAVSVGSPCEDSPARHKARLLAQRTRSVGRQLEQRSRTSQLCYRVRKGWTLAKTQRRKKCKHLWPRRKDGASPGPRHWHRETSFSVGCAGSASLSLCVPPNKMRPWFRTDWFRFALDVQVQPGGGEGGLRHGTKNERVFRVLCSRGRAGRLPPPRPCSGCL